MEIVFKIILVAISLATVCLFLYIGFKISRNFLLLFEGNATKLIAATSLCRYTGIAVALLAFAAGISFDHDTIIFPGLVFFGLGIVIAALPASDSDTKPETLPPTGN